MRENTIILSLSLLTVVQATACEVEGVANAQSVDERSVEQDQGEPDRSPANGLVAPPDAPRADVTSCTEVCNPVTHTGVGLWTTNVTCSEVNGSTEALAGGCNIGDAQAANVRLIDSYPASDTQWRCKAYSNTAGSFDLEACCIECT